MKKYIVVLIAFLLIPVAAGADVIANLTQSNALPDGYLYGQVKVSQGINATTVQFNVEAFTTYLTPGTNFGIQSFGFNTNLLDPITTGPPDGRTPLSYFIFSGPSGWSFSYNQNMSVFGDFELDYDGSGGTRQNPLEFTLQYAPGGTPLAITTANFYIANAAGYHYAAHIADFTNGFNDETSAWFADGELNTPIPEPSTMLLLGSGLVGLVGYGRRRFKK